MSTLSSIRALGASLTFTLAAAGAAHAAAVFDTDLAAFTAANPGLAVEGFENAVVASGTDTAVAGPLNSSTSNAVFAAGSVLAGFSMEPTSGDVYASRDRGGNTGANVSSNSFGADMNITFGPGVTALGIDLLQWFDNNGGWSLEVYDAGNALLGSFATLAGSFVGITSDVDIARLFLNKPDSGAVIDNLRFGAAGGTVPEPSSLLLVALAGLALRGVQPASRRARIQV
jgi:hypothetical protein